MIENMPHLRTERATGSDSRPNVTDTDAVCAALRAGLDLAACSYEGWPFDALLPRLERGRIVVPADVVGARSYRMWQPADGIELPVRVAGLQLGRFVLVPKISTVGVALTVSLRDLALDIAEQCACALAVGLNEGAF